MGTAIKQFSSDDISKGRFSGRIHLWFEAAMISTCQPLFNGLGDNHDVEYVLRKARVIDKSCKPDTESCALIVNFDTMRDARAFVGRLNTYLRKLAAKQARDEKTRWQV